MENKQHLSPYFQNLSKLTAPHNTKTHKITKHQHYYILLPLNHKNIKTPLKKQNYIYSHVIVHYNNTNTGSTT